MVKFLMDRNKRKGFTLIELMIVVAIIGILAAVAIPAFLKYMKRAKTSEALTNIRKVCDGNVAYFSEEYVNVGGTILSKQFVNAPMTPTAIPGINKIVANWETPEWQALKFATESGVLFAYTSAGSTNTGLQSSFTARANGDLDGDGASSLFERVGAVNGTSGDPQLGSGVYSNYPLE